jgi:hypothetical protein
MDEQVAQPLENVFAREPLGNVDRQALPIQEGGWSASSNSLAVFRIDVGATDSIARAATIVHETNVERSMRIGNFVYSIAAGDVQVHSFDDLGTLVARVPLTGWPGQFAPPGTIVSPA